MASAHGDLQVPSRQHVYSLVWEGQLADKRQQAARGHGPDLARPAVRGRTQALDLPEARGPATHAPSLGPKG